MKPIKLAILWHQHQPYYRAGNEFLMPWAWLHATKDYLEMAEHLERRPEMRATINLVPSLLIQLGEYLAGAAHDPVVELMSKPAATLADSEKKRMLDAFFQAHPEHMIGRSPRYKELFEKSREADRERYFQEQDYRDLAVLFSLAWTGEIARMREPFQSLVAKDKNFTEADKQSLAQAQRENVRRIIPLHSELARRGQIELTTSPFYHPILPLLIDTDSAREATPHAELPRNRFHAPEEAGNQIKRARQFFAETVGMSPRGLWPSEGSLSADALTIIQQNGFAWTASDESVLANSLRGESISAGARTIRPEHAPLFPWRQKTPTGEITVFFRNHGLSDDIGFTYQSWRAEDAAGHFIDNVLRIRSGLIAEYGESVMAEACVSVILDGENCWEYYPNNGHDFLAALYARLTTTPEIKPITFSSALAEMNMESLPVLPRFVAGSWINANFNIWIGQPEDNAAWDALYAAYQEIERVRAETIGATDRATGTRQIEAARAELMIAEGSDWCWWYGEEHYSPQQHLFDELYRMHLREVYHALGFTPPETLSIPITRQTTETSQQPRYGAMQPAASLP